MPNKHTDDRVASFFARRAQLWDGLYESDSRIWRWFNRTFRKGMFLRAEISLRTCLEHHCQSVLDVGCGSGRVSCMLAEGGIGRVVGLDIAPEMIELAREHARLRGLTDTCEFRTGDFMTAEIGGGPGGEPPGGRPPGGEQFDAVIALGVFDYLGQPAPFLEKMRSLARKVVVLSAPSPTLVRSPLRKIRYALRNCPVFFYTRSRIRTLMRGAGFEDFDIQRATWAGYVVIGKIAPTD